MHPKPKIPTASEVALRKKLRLLCEFFANLNAEIVGDAEWDETLTPELVARIRAYLAEHQIEPADLMAIRNRPGHWCHGNPYEWLWLLHRYLNHYRSQESGVRSQS
jgi:hypothetical protein